MSSLNDDYDIEINHYDGKFFHYEISVFRDVYSPVAHFRSHSMATGYVMAWLHCIVDKYLKRHPHES